MIYDVDECDQVKTGFWIFLILIKPTRDDSTRQCLGLASRNWIRLQPEQLTEPVFPGKFQHQTNIAPYVKYAITGFQVLAREFIVMLHRSFDITLLTRHHVGMWRLLVQGGNLVVIEYRT